MNFKYHLGQLSLALAASLTLLTLAQERSAVDQQRDSFLDTRPKAATATDGKPAQAARVKRRPGPIGLGYTLFKQAADGSAVRVSPAQEFRSGDRLRLVIEPNVSGYLYVFNSENEGLPEMIFPNPRLNGGDNRVEAHVPYEIPSSQEPNPNLRWFEVQGAAATEHLYLVVTRRRLPEVPTGAALIAHCRGKSGGCAWQPIGTTWNQIAAHLEASAPADQSGAFGQSLASVERQSIERKIALSSRAPAPSVIRISKSPQATMVATRIDLIHK